MEKIRIRPANNNDLETLLEFEQGVIEAERPFDPTLKSGDIRYYDLQEMINSDHIQLLVAEVNGIVVGSGYARIEQSKIFYKHPKHAYLGFMYVRPAYRGIGINRKIIDALQSWSLSKDIYELRLEVYYDNLPAINAYKKVGFSNHLIQMRLGP
jgi:ribosomal protein S18 acetylase RimI-like enzyme